MNRSSNSARAGRSTVSNNNRPSNLLHSQSRKSSRRSSPGSSSSSKPIPPPPQFKPPPLPSEDDDVFIRPITRSRSPLVSLETPSGGSLSPIGEVDTPESSRSVSPNVWSSLAGGAGGGGDAMWKSGNTLHPFVISHDTFIRGGDAAGSSRTPDWKTPKIPSPVHGNGSSQPSSSSTSPVPSADTVSNQSLSSVSLKSLSPSPAPVDRLKENNPPPPTASEPLEKSPKQEKLRQRKADKAESTDEPQPPRKMAKIPDTQVEPPTPPPPTKANVKNDNNIRPTSPAKKTPAPAGSQTKNGNSVQSAVEPMEVETVVASETEPKMKRRASKKITPKKMQQHEGDKKPDPVSKPNSDGEQLMENKLDDLTEHERQVIENENLTAKEKCVITEVLSSRMSRSRSNSRMGGDVHQQEETSEVVRDASPRPDQQAAEKPAREEAAPTISEKDTVADQFSRIDDSDTNVEKGRERVDLGQNIQNLEKEVAESAGVSKSVVTTDITSCPGKNNENSPQAQIQSENLSATHAAELQNATGDQVFDNRSQNAGNVMPKDDSHPIEAKWAKPDRSKPEGLPQQISIEEILPIPLDADESIADLTIEKVREHLLSEEIINKQLEHDLDELVQEKEKLTAKQANQQSNSRTCDKENNSRGTGIQALTNQQLCSIAETKPKEFLDNKSNNSQSRPFDSSSSSLSKDKKYFATDESEPPVEIEKPVRKERKSKKEPAGEDNLKDKGKEVVANRGRVDLNGKGDNGANDLVPRASNLEKPDKQRREQKRPNQDEPKSIASKPSTGQKYDKPENATPAAKPPGFKDNANRPGSKAPETKLGVTVPCDLGKPRTTSDVEVKSRTTEVKGRGRGTAADTGGARLLEVVMVTPGLFLAGQEAIFSADLHQYGLQHALILGQLPSNHQLPVTTKIIQLNPGSEIEDLEAAWSKLEAGGLKSVIVWGEDESSAASIAAVYLARSRNEKKEAGLEMVESARQGTAFNQAILSRYVKKAETGGVVESLKTWLPILLGLCLMYLVYQTLLQHIERIHQSEGRRGAEDEYSYFHILRWP